MRGGFGYHSFTIGEQAAEEFRVKIAQWFYAAEESRLTIPAETTGERREKHRVFLSTLIAFGDAARFKVDNEHIDLKPLGLTAEHIASEVRLLRDTYRSIYENALSETEADEILTEVFGTNG